MSALKKLVLALLGFIVLALLLMFLFAGQAVDNTLNGVEQKGSQPVPESIAALYQTIDAVDLHADPLLWNRDWTVRNTRGQTDLPRERQARVGLQVLGLVTKVPMGQNFDRNPSDSDMLVFAVPVLGYPVKAWFSIQQRALHQIGKLEAWEADPANDLMILRTKADLDTLYAKRAAGSETVGTLIGFEGIQPIEGDLSALDMFFDRGVRMVGLTHFFDNEAAGSAHGWDKYGLTDLGREAVRKLEALNIAIDLAHASPATIDDVLAMVTRPVVVSHTGVKGTCPGPRNLSDEHLRKIAATGGMVGIGYFEGAVCGTSPDHVADAMIYAIDLVGVEHVALGSDFDGAVTTRYDVTGIPLIAAALKERGVSDDDIRAIFGGNARRVLRQLLPE